MAVGAWKLAKPSERQVAYATSLGIDIPAGARQGDVSRLINLALYGDAHEAHFRSAAAVGYDSPRPKARDDLLEDLNAFLLAPGNERALCQWYVFRVYRHIADHDTNADIETPDDSALQGVVGELLSSPKLLTSARRAVESSSLRAFSSAIDDDATGSTSTAAYRHVLEPLRAIHQGPVPASTRSNFSGQPQSPPRPYSGEPIKVIGGHKLSSSAKTDASTRGAVPSAWLELHPDTPPPDRQRQNPPWAFNTPVIVVAVLLVLISLWLI